MRLPSDPEGLRGRKVERREMHNLVRIQDVTITFPTLGVMSLYV